MGGTPRELKGRCGFFFLLLVAERSISQRARAVQAAGSCSGSAIPQQWQRRAGQQGADGLWLHPAAAVEASMAGDSGLLGSCSMSGGMGS